MPKKSSRRVYARILNGDRNRTRAVLSIFDRHITQWFSGAGHYDKAVAWVNMWDTHLADEWMRLLTASANVMEDFIEDLKAEGVPQATIDAAMERMRSRAKG